MKRRKTREDGKGRETREDGSRGREVGRRREKQMGRKNTGKR